MGQVIRDSVPESAYLSPDEIDALLNGEIIGDIEVEGDEIFPATDATQTFQRYVIIGIIFAALFSSIGVGFYMGERFPFQNSNQVKNERSAGRTLLAAWPLLDDKTKQLIVHDARSNPYPAKKI